MTDKDRSLDDLEALLAGGDDETKQETISELRRSGVDTTQFFSRIRQVVQNGYSKQLRSLAEREMKETFAARAAFFGQLKDMTRDKMLAIFGELQQGAFGAGYQQAALARCRNREASELSDEELRSWLEDIGDILGDPSNET